MIVFDEFNNALRRCEVCGKAKENVSGKEKPSLCLACQTVWQHINDRWNILKKEVK
jgi:hypothetical protein